jgi:hypothetical protein
MSTLIEKEEKMTEIEVSKHWLARTRVVEKEHFRCCVSFRRKHYIWGSLLISASALASALTVIVERSALAAIVQHNTPHTPDIAETFFYPGLLLAFFVPVVAALVTFLRYQARSASMGSPSR